MSVQPSPTAPTRQARDELERAFLHLLRDQRPDLVWTVTRRPAAPHNPEPAINRDTAAA